MDETKFAICPLCGMYGGHEGECPNRRRIRRKGVQEWDEPQDAPSTCEEPST